MRWELPTVLSKMGVSRQHRNSSAINTWRPMLKGGDSPSSSPSPAPLFSISNGSLVRARVYVPFTDVPRTGPGTN